jgi:hypothetical protein
VAARGPAATRESVATTPRASAQARLRLERESMSDHSGTGTPVSVLRSSTRSFNGL